MLSLEKTVRSEFDRAILKGAVTGVMAGLFDYGAGKLDGHPRHPLHSFILVGTTFVIAFIADCYIKPRLARKREAEDEQQAQAARWRMH